MLKNILNVPGVHELTKSDQKTFNGGALEVSCEIVCATTESQLLCGLPPFLGLCDGQGGYNVL